MRLRGAFLSFKTVTFTHKTTQTPTQTKVPAVKTHADAHGHDGTNRAKSSTSSAAIAAPDCPRQLIASPRVLPLHPAAGMTPTVPVLIARRARCPPAGPPCAAVHRTTSRRRPSLPWPEAARSLPRRWQPMGWALSCSLSSSVAPTTRPARCSRPASAHDQAAGGQWSGYSSSQQPKVRRT